MERNTDTKTEEPVVEFPVPEGDRYEAVVPDMLDLADHAGLAINGIGGTLDPDMEYLPFGIVHWSSKTPHIQHWASADVRCGAKLCGSFPLMRIISGKREYRCGSNLLWVAQNPSAQTAYHLAALRRGILALVGPSVRRD